jgi:gamma-glutamylcyclotransferase (GGCT)/AIG2-like uncharacterized protein YtfP
MPEPTDLSTISTTERLFFVYGTLRQAGDNDITRLLPVPRFVGAARIKGVMVHLGDYPGVILGGDSDIIGEVYAVSAELEAKLDAIESEYPAQSDEYVKRSINVVVNGQSLVCSVYEINPRYAVGKPCIASGDWIKDR